MFNSVFIFILGLFAGSFLNVLIDRLPTGEQVFSGRSHCDKCKKNIPWHDLIPVFSWIILRGRCRFCSSSIPVRNLTVEMITGSLFLLASLSLMSKNYELRITNYELHSFTTLIYIIEVLLVLSIISCLIVIFFIDLKHQIIPDEMVIVGVLSSLILNSTHYFSQNPIVSWTASFFIHHSSFIISALGASAFFLLLIVITKGRGMGFGDVKLAFFMGLFLGYPKIVNALYFAFLTGALISVMLILLRQKKFGQTIAFGPFLAAGTLFAYFINYNLLSFL